MHLLYHSKALVLGALFSAVSFSSVVSMELIAANAVSSAEPVTLYKNQRDFFVEDENAAYRVETNNMNPLLQEIVKRQAMGKFVGEGQGYIRVKQMSDGQYALDAKVRGNGGGPVTGTCAYWGTKSAGWVAFAAAVWATHGEMLMHTVEYAHMIESAATAAGVLGTMAPTP